MPRVLQQLPTAQGSPPSQEGPGYEAHAEACRYCGAVGRPTLSAGTGPHAIRANCPHCGRFVRWVSVRAPSERLARRAKARLKAMQARPASELQLAYLRGLGDGGPTPRSMAEASERIDRLIQERQSA